MRSFYLFLVSVFFASTIYAQLDYNANDVVNPYEDDFRFGMNQGYFPPWSDKQLAEIAAGNPARNIPGVGVNSLRPALPEWLMEIYGYDFRKSTYEYYESLGITDHTVIMEGPADWHRDLYNYCGNGNDNDKSRLFANLYSPIWDNGENGTPVNDTNYLALYLYKAVNIYKDHIKFYEIWNEPDFFFGGDIWNYRDPGNSWWVRNPDPCEYQLHAPIFHYIRTLRISYEVIKSVDPDAYVSIGALGMPHFLDAVLRNTDNPAGGSVTADYPLGGGAYFDVMGYHEYPHIDGSLWFYDWRTGEGPKDFQRNSDRAVENGIYRKKNEFQTVLDKYGYDGNTFPEKIWIITESNLPRKHFGDFRYYGSDEMQRNYIIKAAIGAMKTDVVQFHPFTLGDKKSEAEASFEFDLMGMYKKLRDIEPYSQQVNNVGIAYKTTSDLLFGTAYDEKRTLEMKLPEGIEGGAFRDKEGEFVYALWAKTMLDRSEAANATYSFPTAFEIEELEGYPWNWSYQKNTSFDQSSQEIQLTGSPLFFKVKTASTCVCDAVYDPVCGSDGVEYSNACVAECNGIVDYESGTCEIEGEYMDLEITELSATPNPFDVFSRVTFRVEVANRGNVSAGGVVLEFPIPRGELAYVEASTSQGGFRVAARQWDVGTLAAGESASLDFALFTLVRKDINVYAEVIAANPADFDSTPDNGNGTSAQEDDEANLLIKYSPRVITTPKEVEDISEIRIAPNPTGGILNVNFDNPTEQAVLKILDLQGKLIKEYQKVANNFLEINVSELPSGVYMLVIQNDSSIQNRLFIKE